MKNITILGAGLAGALLGIYLAKRQYHIDMYEARADVRLSLQDSGRSINLALSCRGLTSLVAVDLRSDVEKLMVPMRGRAIHEKNGEIAYQSFGRHVDEYINAIRRHDLHTLLLNQFEKMPNVHLHFNAKVIDIDLEKKILHFENQNSASYQRLIGADGAGSVLRERLMKKKHILSERVYLDHGYKELSISQANSKHLAHEHLHLWPRSSFLLLGNPNRDHSVTGSLFLPHEGKNSFAALDNELRVDAFFQQAFSDAYPLMPNLIYEFFQHPTGNMGTIKCTPWYYQDHCLLIGDAAHGIVPFFGQGMNAAFEDCRILNVLLDQYQDDWTKVMPAFYESRKMNTDAVAAMSLDNYHEIQTDIQSPQFIQRKQLEQVLMHRYPERYISKHVLVMFTNTPYAQAYLQGQIQAELLSDIISIQQKTGTIDWSKVDSMIEQYEKKIESVISR